MLIIIEVPRGTNIVKFSVSILKSNGIFFDRNSPKNS